MLRIKGQVTLHTGNLGLHYNRRKEIDDGQDHYFLEMCQGIGEMWEGSTYEQLLNI